MIEKRFQRADGPGHSANGRAVAEESSNQVRPQEATRSDNHRFLARKHSGGGPPRSALAALCERQDAPLVGEFAFTAPNPLNGRSHALFKGLLWQQINELPKFRDI